MDQYTSVNVSTMVSYFTKHFPFQKSTATTQSKKRKKSVQEDNNNRPKKQNLVKPDPVPNVTLDTAKYDVSLYKTS